MKKSIVATVALLFSAVAVAVCGGCGEKNAEVAQYTLKVHFYSESMSLSCEQTIDFDNHFDSALYSVKLSVAACAFREGAQPTVPKYMADEAYPNGMSYGDFIVTKSQINGRNCEYALGGEGGNILSLDYPDGLLPNSRATVVLAYTVVLAQTPQRLGYGKGFVNLGNFYPVLCLSKEGIYCEYPYYSVGDPFYSEVADYTVTLTAPNDYSAFASGETRRVNTDEKDTEYEFYARNARDFAIVLKTDAECFQSDAECGAKVSYACGKENSNLLSAAVAAVDFFSERFDDYAYSTLTVAETQFIYGGMEYSSLVFVSENLSERERLFAVVHEIAHQWWYSAVGSDQVAESYLDESLAEYSALLFFEYNPEFGIDKNAELKKRDSARNEYLSMVEKIGKTPDTRIKRTISEFSGDYEYVINVYYGGALMLDGMRDTVGDKRFFSSLKKYYSQNKFGISDTEKFLSCFGSTARSYTLSWLEGKVA